MPAPSRESAVSIAKQELIQRVVQQAADENWSWDRLVSALGVTEQTARTYLRQYGCTVDRMVRHEAVALADAR